MEREGLEPSTSSLRTNEPELKPTQTQEFTDAPSDAYTEAYIERPDSVQIDHALALICERWEALPEAVKIGIAAMVEAAAGSLPPLPPKRV